MAYSDEVNDAVIANLPPLCREEDRAALIEALSEGLLDVVMSDHNPQDVEVKRGQAAGPGDAHRRCGTHGV